MGQLHNIFSKEKLISKKVCPNPSAAIIVDTREKQSLVFSELVSLHANVSREKLEVADFLVGSIAIERKTYADFCSSITSQRLYNQLQDLSQYDKPLLLLEGFYYNYGEHLHENVIRSSCLAITTKFHIPILYTRDETDTARWLIAAARREERGKQMISLRKSKRPKDIESQKRYILESFPKIGPTSACKLLEKFGSLKDIFSASKKVLYESGILEEKTLNQFISILKSKQ